MSEPFLAEIKIVSFNFPPKGWAYCNGQTLPINQNQALFSLLGTTFGGNGQTTFALPDFRGRVPVHFGGSMTLGQSAGQSAHTLTQFELPEHTHGLGVSSTNGNVASPSGAVLGANINSPYAPLTTPIALASGSIVPTGGSQPHENMQPYLVLNFVIALQGIFPSQN